MAELHAIIESLLFVSEVPLSLVKIKADLPSSPCTLTGK